MSALASTHLHIKIASLAGDVECLEILIEQGASINAPSASGTPLLWAISSEEAACTDFLLDHGADVNATGDNGASACMLAVATGDPDATPPEEFETRQRQ